MFQAARLKSLATLATSLLGFPLDPILTTHLQPIAPTITHIINFSLSAESFHPYSRHYGSRIPPSFPLKWKTILFFLPFLSKTVEKVVVNQILEFFPGLFQVSSPRDWRSWFFQPNNSVIPTGLLLLPRLFEVPSCALFSIKNQHVNTPDV